MSCEQLRAEIEKKLESVPRPSKESSNLLACDWALSDGCPNERSQLTHTARILSAESNAEVDRIWQKAKQKTEALLSRL